MAAMTLTEQQKKVVEDRGGTLLVSAAAGSGKTKVLVDRVMEKILRDGKNINEFLIITFTNAAAAELRGKISDAISANLAQIPENRHLQRQQNLLELSQISTVHAFCGNLIRQYGYLKEIPADYAMLEDSEREIMLDRLLENLLEEEYSRNRPEFSDMLDRLGPGRNDSKLTDLVKSLFEAILSQPYPEKWLKAQQVYIPEGTDLRETIWGKILLQEANDIMEPMEQLYMDAICVLEADPIYHPKILPYYQDQLNQVRRAKEALLLPWDEIPLQLTIEFPRLTKPKAADETQWESIKYARDYCKDNMKAVESLFSHTSQELIRQQNSMAPAAEELKQLVLKLYHSFSREKRRKNVLDFSDQEHIAISLLVDERGRPTEVAREVSTRFTEIMVDEYQDSNRVQELIFTAICQEGDTNRFLVGDVKQSIYGFRQAEPGIFIEKQNSFLPAEEALPGAQRKLVLSKNFRSRPEILEAVNFVFENVMSPEVGDIVYDDDQHLYPGLEAYPQDGMEHVELHLLDIVKAPEDSGDEETKYRQEAAFVANRISRMLQDKVPVRDGEQLRPVTPGDIAILTRSWSSVHVYAKALSDRGIPVNSGSGGDLFSCEEIMVLRNLIKTLDNPHQDIPLICVLCSPLFRFSNETLALVRRNSRQERFYDALRESDLPEVKSALETLERMKKDAANLSAEKFIWRVLYHYGFTSCCCAMEEGREKRKNLLSFFWLCQNAADGRFLYLYELDRYLDRLSTSGVSVSGQNPSGVTLTTIHKSKGLEYPVVFLSDISRKFNMDDLKEPLILDNEAGIGLKITDPVNRLRYSGLSHHALQYVKEAALLSEEMRILYVAMTRPKDYLIMTYSGTGVSGTLKTLSHGAGIPAQTGTVRQARCMGDWILLAALSRLESVELSDLIDYHGAHRVITDYPWCIKYHILEGLQEKVQYRAHSGLEEASTISVERALAALSWKDPNSGASRTPSKLTATQLKGRDKDEESRENTPAARSMPVLRKPEFLQEKRGLTAQEAGTATHLYLQYANYEKSTNIDDVMEELDRLVEEEFLTAVQAAAVSPEAISTLFSSELGQRLCRSDSLIREFKFSILTEAGEYYPEAAGEEILLQGVVDAAFLEDDGMVVVDFKTDRVTEHTVLDRAAKYRPQLLAYKKALERIWKKPVKKTILYFLSIGKSVEI